MVQHGVVVLQLALFTHQGAEAQLEFALQDGRQLLQEFMKALGFGPGGLQLPLQAPQGRGG
jgi:hypothetical protein